MFGFGKNKNNNGLPEFAMRDSVKLKKINYVDTDIVDFDNAMKNDTSSVLKLVPVNYYAVKTQYIQAVLYYAGDYSEAIVCFERYVCDKKQVKTQFYVLDATTLEKMLAKIGVIVPKKAN